MNSPLFVRDLPPGMGRAVAERTVLRKIAPRWDNYKEGDKFVTKEIPNSGRLEDWGDVAKRVAIGNCSLEPKSTDQDEMESLIASGALMMAGRHLQQGDENQRQKNGELFYNCASAPTSFLMFQLLLNGTGVGRCYDDDMMLVNWDYAPAVWCVLDEAHSDYSDNEHLSARNAKHMFNGSKDLMWFSVPDSREGWAKALELIEIAAFEKVHKDKILVLDFSEVRPKGAPIKGMQNRPSSGPVALMNAFQKIMMIRGAGLDKWKQAMYIDHFMAECVLVGGARRAARIATKYWKDKTILDFIKVKRPVEYEGKNVDEVAAFRKDNQPLNFLWSANNSIMVDEEFWEQCTEAMVPKSWARQVFEMATECAYGDGTGEPGFINIDKIKQDNTGWGDLKFGNYVGSDKYQIEDNSYIYLAKLAKRAKSKKYNYTLNPCGEQPLVITGAYCTLGAIAPYHCRENTEIEGGVSWFASYWDGRFEDAVRMAVRALIRVNLMDSLYKKEVKRTNRIGVGLIGIHEWMWTRFGLTFREALRETEKSQLMWDTLAHMSRAARDEAITYSESLWLNVPHTITTIPPGGTISKLFNLTEGAHLPAMKQYLRWIQFRNDDPLVRDYQERGYPTKVLKQYAGHTIVGFPTKPRITEIMPQDKIVTAAEATPEEQYKWIQLLEKYWLEGDTDQNYGSQISYTLKFDPNKITLQEFQNIIKEHQSKVRVCAIMPQEEQIAAEYQPEEPISVEEYERIKSKIEDIAEEVSIENMKCDGDACSLEFNEEKGVIMDGGYV